MQAVKEEERQSHLLVDKMNPENERQSHLSVEKMNPERDKERRRRLPAVRSD
jgi:hypothetical protein